MNHEVYSPHEAQVRSGGPPDHLRPAVIRTVLLLFLVSWLLVSSAYSGAVSPTSGIAGLDFAVFYHAAARLNAGQPLYQPHLPPSMQGGLYVYCPLLAMLLRPLAHLPFHKAMQVWFFVNATCLILAVLLYGASARLTWKTASLLAVLLLVSFRYWDTTMNFALGQSNSLMLAFIGAMLWADSRKRWLLLGMLIALAALFKIWLIGLLLYLALRRRWREAAASVGAFAVVTGGLFAVVGWPQLPDYLRSMMQAKAHGEQYSIMNSVLGFANLHLRVNPLVSPILDSRVCYFLFVGACLAGIVWGFARLWQVLRDPSSLEARLAFGLVLTSVLLLLPSYENGYSVYCFPLLWTLLASPDADGRRRQGVSQAMLASGIVFYLIFSRAYPVYAPFAPAYQHGFRSLIVSVSFYGTVLLWSAGFYCLSKVRTAAGSLSSSAP